MSFPCSRAEASVSCCYKLAYACFSLFLDGKRRLVSGACLSYRHCSPCVSKAGVVATCEFVLLCLFLFARLVLFCCVL